MFRKGKKYNIDEVLSKYSADNIRVNFDGDLIKMNSQRYENFKLHGIVCVTCKITGKYFYKERHHENDPYHFNLYGIDKKGEEILMTKDHIIPKYQNGSNSMNNYQTMCCKCNYEKGSGYQNRIFIYNKTICEEITMHGNPKNIKNIKFTKNLYLEKLRSKCWIITNGKNKVYNNYGKWMKLLLKKNIKKPLTYTIKNSFINSINIINKLKKEK